MKFKKLISFIMVVAMCITMVACGEKKTDSNPGTDKSADTAADTADDASKTNDDAAGDKADAAPSGKLVVWTLAADLQQFSQHYMETYPDVEVETVVIAPADYPTKVQSALLGGEKEPDIIVGEPQMLQNMFDAGFFEDLNKAPYNAQDYADKIVDYVWKVGQDASGIQRAISYQITPAGIYYRRDIADKVFNTSDPAEIGKLFKDYPTILETAKKLKSAGYKIFASDGEMNYFSGDSAWVVDGALNVSKSRLDYMDLAIQLYQNEYTAFAASWSAPWYQAMSGPVPILTADVNVWDETALAEASADAQMTEVFAYGLPAWGTLVMRDNYGDTAGKWGVCSGPAYGFGGGTYIGISANSARKDLAWDYLKFCTLTQETMEWWIQASEGDTVSYIPTLEAHENDENSVYGGEKLYQFWLEQAKGIDYSKVTKYDTIIGDAWGAAITSIKTGEKSKEDALTEFYDLVESNYPELTINR